MFGTHDPWLFALSLLVFALTPGPDLMFTLTRSLQHGARAGVAAAFGVGAGCLVHTAAAAFGLAALLAASAEAFTVLRWVGAAYLLWLAVGMFRATPAAAGGPAPAPRQATSDAWRIFRQGFLTNALNPKVAMFFLAFLPQFIDVDAPDKTTAFLFLGGWFTAQGIAVLVLFAVAVAPLGRRQVPAAVRRALRATGGALFVALAARLAWSKS